MLIYHSWINMMYTAGLSTKEQQFCSIWILCEIIFIIFLSNTDQLNANIATVFDRKQQLLD